MTGSDSAGVWGIGVGPGDPELLTLKALRLIRAADVIVYPAPEEGESFARSIVAPHLPGGQREIAIRMALGDGSFPKADIYDAAADEILKEVAAGRRVAVLCEGDPFFYGSFIYLYGRLAGRCPVAIVPGVSSLMACAGAAETPLALRNQSLTVLPGPLPEAELRLRLGQCEAAAIIKVGRHLAKIRAVLEELGLTDRARYIERASLGTQRVLPLREAAAGEA
ncbi:MAG TPA: precorrin-2 C(20)-methyltransferase, partial [Dongiaceae bacterium]